MKKLDDFVNFILDNADAGITEGYKPRAENLTKNQRTLYIRIMKNEKPKDIDKKVVKIHDVLLDSDYAQWLNEIKSRYRSA